MKYEDKFFARFSFSDRISKTWRYFGLSARGPAGDDGGGGHPGKDDKQREPLD
jgi:hypothetical protein